MLLRAGHAVLTASLAFSLFSQASPAQLVSEAAAARHHAPLTPFDRYVRPSLDRLAASKRGGASRAQTAPAANATTAIAPNFGGYLGATTYPARAANSAQYDPLNNGMSAVLAADFDKDGHPDIATVQSDGTLNIFLNSGSGALAAPAGYLNPSPNVQYTAVTQALIADLNGDGYPDVVTFDVNNSVVIAYLNAGNGTFNQPQLTQLDTSIGSAQAITIGDVNGDGKSDVVVGYWNGGTPVLTVQTLQGKGDGTFTQLAAQNFTLAGNVVLQGTTPLALGDVNGDGKLDLAILIDAQTGRFSGSYSVSVSLGSGNGTFGTLGPSLISGSYVSGIFNASSVQILDVNNDGKLDVVLDCNDLIYAALGNGANIFKPAVTSPFQSSGSTIFIDMNGDGVLDAVTPGGSAISISLGKGDGTFTAPAANAQYAADVVNGASAQLAVADFSGNKKLDVAALNIDEFQVSIFNGSGNGTLQGPLVQSLPADYIPTDVALVGAFNANADAYTDLVLADSATTGFLYTGLSDGKGSFKYMQSLASLPADLSGVETFQGDFNGDGKQDLLLTGAAGELWTSLSKGDGTFGAPVLVSLPALACSLGGGVAGDVNGDGKVDMVIAYPGDAACGAGSTYPSGYLVLKGNGDGTFQAATLFPAGEELVSVALADMNLDGNLDLLTNDLPSSDPTGYKVSLELGNGDGSFGAPLTVLSNTLVADMKVADMNSDGKPDLVVASAGLISSDVSTAGIVIVNGNGDGTFGQHSQIAIGNYFSTLQVADVNGDGIPDIEAALDTYSGEETTYNGFVTLLGLGGEGFTAAYNENVVAGSSAVLTGNFFNDNAADVVVGSPGGVAVFLGQGGTTLTLSAASSAISIGDSAALTVTVAATMSGRPTPTGTVSFYDGTTLLGTGSVNAGTAMLSAGALAVGAHSITAFYTGDANFNQNTSAATTVTVATVAPAFTLAGKPGTLTLKQGANGTVILTLAANATFSGPVTLTCAGAPTDATCGFDSSTITLTPGESSTATLVVGTTGTVAATHSRATPWERVAGAVSLAGLAAFFLGRRRRLRYLGALGALLLAVATLGVSGCSSSGTTKTTTPTVPSAPVVSTGSFTLTVTATATGSAATAQTASVVVTVN